MRLFLFYTLVFLVFLNAATTTDKKIKNSKKTLSAVKNEKKHASRRLDKIAKDIKRAEKDIDVLEKKLDELSRDQSENEKKYVLLRKELKESTEAYEQTSRELEEKRHKFISLLSDQFSITFAMEQAHDPTRKSIMTREVYQTYKKQNLHMLEALKSDIKKVKKRKEDKLYLRNHTQNKIRKIIKQREAYAEKKEAKRKLLKKLSEDEEKYNAKLQKIVDKQNSLRSTLAQLNILKKKEVEKARKQAAARKEAIRLEKERQRKIRKEQALARAKEKKAKAALKAAKTAEAKKAAKLAAKQATKEVEVVRKKAKKQSQRVRNVNSSYQKPKVYAYRSGKTISPIAGARVIKKFGTYVDPIYKIKIFNESITLLAPSSNAKVQNVKDGKVVFAGKSSMLGKVVVVAHSGKMHTVYAGLSMIAPNIKTGRKIKRGYVVGRVKQKLMFQATKNSRHINPLKLIKI